MTCRTAGALLLVLVAACASARAGPERYRLSKSGTHWDVSRDDAVLQDLRPRYPEFFEVILDPELQRLPNMLTLRDDLERTPVDRRNFDALNSIAIGYFEINYRAEARRGDGLAYLSNSQRAAKLLAVPWRGYAETDDASLRQAILDFFDDAGNGHKLLADATSRRVGPIVASLAKKEQDPTRLERIQRIVSDIEAGQAAQDGRAR